MLESYNDSFYIRYGLILLNLARRIPLRRAAVLLVLVGITSVPWLIAGNVILLELTVIVGITYIVRPRRSPYR